MKAAIGPLFFLSACLVPLASRAQPLPKIRLDRVFPALTIDKPVGMEEAPDGSGRLFIVLQDGILLVVRKGSDGGQSKEFLNIVDRKPHFQLEDGLLGMAFHPGFKSNGLIYVDYTLKSPSNQRLQPLNFPYRTVISEFKVSGSDPDKADLSSERVILEVPQPFWNHKGGQIGFGRDGYLYISLGDGGQGNDPFNNAQNTADLHGKILRIDVNSRSTFGSGRRQKELAYGIPKDNPFAGETDKYGVRKEIWAWGLRNVWRFSWDRETGDLWAGDVGQDDWEEVDLIVKGGNYGWCVREGFHHFKPGPEGARYIDPVIEYGHNAKLAAQSPFPDHGEGTSITGGYVYRGKRYPSLRGVYVYGDYTLGKIWGFRYENGKLLQHGLLLAQPRNIPSFAQDADGELYMLTGTYGDESVHESDGQIYSLAVPNP